MTGVYLPDPDAEIDTTSILFLDNGKIMTSEIGMISAYLYDTTHLNLEEAARIANARDEQAANDLLFSWFENTLPVVEGAVLSILA